MKNTKHLATVLGLALAALITVLAGCEVFVGPDHEHHWHHDDDWDHR